MSKKWTEAYPRDNSIVDYKQFNEGYNAYKSSFNGGIDRTMTPSGVLSDVTVKDGAFHRCNIFFQGDMNVLVDTSTGTSGIGDFRGLSYNTYAGGWLTVDSFTINNLKDGMLHWEFNTHIYNNTEHSDHNPKFTSLRLLFDGVEVCTAYQIPAPILTYRMVCDVPVTASPNTVTVQARSVAPSTTENFKCLFSLLAMRHLFVGRWR
jgi:hypothetical protein